MHTNAVIREDLGILVSQYAIDNTSFMGSKILAPMDVSIEAGEYKIIEYAESQKKPVSLDRAPSAAFQRVSRGTSTDTYRCYARGLEEPIDDTDIARNSKIINQLQQGKAQFLVHNLLRAQEVRVAAIAQDTSNVFPSARQYGITTEWSNIAATPRKDIDQAKLKMYGYSGIANGMGARLCLAMSGKVLANLRNVTEIKEGLKYTADGLRNGISDAALASFLGVDEVVSSPIQNGGVDIWDDEYAWLYYYSPSPVFEIPRFGNIFNWSPMVSGQYTVETYREEKVTSDIVRVRQYCDEKAVNPRCAIMLTNITA